MRTIEMIKNYIKYKNDVEIFQEAIYLLTEEGREKFKPVMDILYPEVRWRRDKLKKLENMEIWKF